MEDGVWIQTTSSLCACVTTGCFKRNHAVKIAAKEFFRNALYFTQTTYLLTYSMEHSPS